MSYDPCEQCGSDENAKAPEYYTEADNSLRKNWHVLSSRFRSGGVMLLNPPFAKIGPWAEKCAYEGPHLMHGLLIALVVPASVGSNWYAEHVEEHAWSNFLKGRPSFDGKDPFPKDIMVSVFGGDRHINSGNHTWDWRATLPPGMFHKKTGKLLTSYRSKE